MELEGIEPSSCLSPCTALQAIEYHSQPLRENPFRWGIRKGLGTLNKGTNNSKVQEATDKLKHQKKTPVRRPFGILTREFKPHPCGGAILHLEQFELLLLQSQHSQVVRWRLRSWSELVNHTGKQSLLLHGDILASLNLRKGF